MLTVTAFVAFQLRVEELPVTMALGAAEIVTVGSVFTVTVMLSEAEPPGPVALMEYVVVTVGLTARDPLRATVPMPWSMLTDVTFVEVQLNVLELPWRIGFGDALMSTVGIPYTFTVTLLVADPAVFVAVAV